MSLITNKNSISNEQSQDSMETDKMSDASKFAQACQVYLTGSPDSLKSYGLVVFESIYPSPKENLDKAFDETTSSLPKPCSGGVISNTHKQQSSASGKTAPLKTMDTL
jgi:hypothetical protein